MKRGYNEKLMRKQILNTREHSRNDLLEWERERERKAADVWQKVNIQHRVLPSLSKW